MLHFNHKKLTEEQVEEFIEYFLNKFPSFESVKEKISKWLDDVICGFSILKTGNCYDMSATALVVAHYLTVYELADDVAGSTGASSGIVSSASVGDVSVSYQALVIEDNFESFFATTIYGRDFLRWIASIGGAMIIN